MPSPDDVGAPERPAVGRESGSSIGHGAITPFPPDALWSVRFFGWRE